MASYDSPPSPLSSSPSEPSRRTTTEHTTARSKARHSKHHHRSSSYLFHHSDIAQLLISEEREARELREAISTLTERVRLETSRADSAEQRLTSTLLKVKEATSTRLSVQQDFNRVSEELRLYKLQLENAQKEISKAQEVVDQLEKERYEAEECAARARTTARKLKEEKLVMQAREEGRKEGMQEGFERGRRLGFEEGRTEGYESGRAAALRELARSARVVEDPLPPPTRRPVSTRQSSSRLRQTTLPTDVPEDIRIVSPPSRPVTGTFTNIPTPEPVIVQTAHVSQYTPPLNPTDYIPDGWIPTLDDDKRIRLPPPHELNMPTTTPTTSPPAGVSPPVDPETPLLMVPPPPTPYADPSAAPSMPQPIAVPQYETGPPSASVEDYPSDTESSAQRTRPRPKRRSSSESQSTTISQFEILGPPIAPSARSVGGVERPGSVLSAIVEERERSSSGGNVSPLTLRPFFGMQMKSS